MEWSGSPRSDWVFRKTATKLKEGNMLWVFMMLALFRFDSDLGGAGLKSGAGTSLHAHDGMVGIPPNSTYHALDGMVGIPPQ
jgi:hypothetical protein